MKYCSLLLFLMFAVSVNAQTTISPLTPADGDTIETKNPLISWFVLSGNTSPNSREFYELVVVELKPEQSPEAGITVNVPLLKMEHIQGMQVFYPYDAPALQEGKRYGWQVHKIINNTVAEKSEAWEFIIGSPKKPEYTKYTTLRKKSDGSVYEAKGGKIFFKMDETYYSENLKAVIYNEQMKIVKKDVKDDSKGEHNGEFNVKSNGSNFYELDLGNISKTGTYQLEVFDAKGQRYILKFNVR